MGWVPGSTHRKEEADSRLAVSSGVLVCVTGPLSLRGNMTFPGKPTASAGTLLALLLDVHTQRGLWGHISVSLNYPVYPLLNVSHTHRAIPVPPALRKALNLCVWTSPSGTDRTSALLWSLALSASVCLDARRSTLLPPQGSPRD